MTEAKRVLNYSIDNSKQLIDLVEGLSNLNADIDAESTPSSIKISIYGSEDKVRKFTKKVHKLVEESRSD